MIQKLSIVGLGLMISTTALAGDWTKYLNSLNSGGIQQDCLISTVGDLQNPPKSLKKDVVSFNVVNDGDIHLGTATLHLKNATLLGSPLTKIVYHFYSSLGSSTTYYFADTKFMSALPKFYFEDSNGLISRPGVKRFWASKISEESFYQQVELPASLIPSVGNYYQTLRPLSELTHDQYSLNFTTETGYLTTDQMGRGVFVYFDANKRVLHCQRQDFESIDKRIREITNP